MKWVHKLKFNKKNTQFKLTDDDLTFFCVDNCLAKIFAGSHSCSLSDDSADSSTDANRPGDNLAINYFLDI